MEQIKDGSDLVKINWPTPGKLRPVLCGKDVQLKFATFATGYIPNIQMFTSVRLKNMMGMLL